MIELNNLNIFVQQRLLLRNINLNLPSVGCYRLKGENGSGKTTFLEFLAGIKYKFDGDRKINKNLKISYLPQISRHNPKIFLNLKDICSKTTDFYPEYLHNRPWHLSSEGERRKALIARCITDDSDIFLLDEPFNHLDEATSKFLDLFLTKLSEKKLVIYVSHDWILKNTIDIEMNQWKY